MYYVYALKSVKYDRIYIGLSSNPANRLKQHNAGQTFSTKPYKPYVLIHQELCETRTAARSREKFLKSGVGREWIREKYMGQ